MIDQIKILILSPEHTFLTMVHNKQLKSQKFYILVIATNLCNFLLQKCYCLRYNNNNNILSVQP